MTHRLDHEFEGYTMSSLDFFGKVEDTDDFVGIVGLKFLDRYLLSCVVRTCNNTTNSADKPPQKALLGQGCCRSFLTR